MRVTQKQPPPQKHPDTYSRHPRTVWAAVATARGQEKGVARTIYEAQERQEQVGRERRGRTPGSINMEIGFYLPLLNVGTQKKPNYRSLFPGFLFVAARTKPRRPNEPHEPHEHEHAFYPIRHILGYSRYNTQLIYEPQQWRIKAELHHLANIERTAMTLAQSPQGVSGVGAGSKLGQLGQLGQGGPDLPNHADTSPSQALMLALNIHVEILSGPFRALPAIVKSLDAATRTATVELTIQLIGQPVTLTVAYDDMRLI